MADDIRIDIVLKNGVMSLRDKIPDNIRVYIRDYDAEDMADDEINADVDGTEYRLFEIF